jgi:ATP:corrinoid adenosyltransferase
MNIFSLDDITMSLGKRQFSNASGSGSRGVNSRNSNNTRVNKRRRVEASTNVWANLFSDSNQSNISWNYGGLYSNQNGTESADEKKTRKRIEIGKKIPELREFHKLLPHQRSYLWKVEKILSQRANTKFEKRGMIVNHTTGSGKTTSILGTMLEYLKTGRKVILVTTVANKKSNSPKVYSQNMKNFFPEAIPALLGYTTENSNTRDAFRNNAKRMDAEQLTSLFKSMGVRFLSYEEFGSRMGYVDNPPKDAENFRKSIDKHGAVILVDEAHELVQPNSKKDRELKAIEGLSEGLVRLANDTLPDGRSKFHVYLFTATPGDTLSEWTKMMSYVRPKNTPTDFIQFVRGPSMVNALVKAGRYMMIDRADISKNIDKVGQVTHHDGYQTEISPVHYGLILAYLSRYAKTNNQTRVLNEAKKTEILETVRTMQNYLTEQDIRSILPTGIKMNAKRSLFKALSNGSLGLRAVDLPSIRDGAKAKRYYVSEKIFNVVKCLANSPGKQLVYSSDRHTLRLISFLLFHKYNFEQVSMRGGKELPKFSGQKKRMIFAYFSNALAKAVEVFNDPNNLRGENVKILGVTKDGYQGLDIKALRGVHIVDQLMVEKQHRQLRGRAGRAYALHPLLQNERTTGSLPYISVPSDPNIGRLSEVVSKRLMPLDISIPISAGFEVLRELHTLQRENVGRNGYLQAVAPSINKIIMNRRMTQNVKDVNTLTSLLNEPWRINSVRQPRIRRSPPKKKSVKSKSKSITRIQKKSLKRR